MKQINQYYQALCETAHRKAEEKGWWENPLSLQSNLMLIITECAEMVNADRRRKYANIGEMKKAIGNRSIEETPFEWKNAFEAYVKDTVEDELADTMIRIADLAGFLKVDFSRFNRINYQRDFDKYEFADNVFVLVKALVNEGYSKPRRILFAMQYIIDFADYIGCDLNLHIRMKLAYNSTRPIKHGKSY